MVATDVASRGIGMIFATPLALPLLLPSDALTFFVVRTVALLSILAMTRACLAFMPVSVGFRLWKLVNLEGAVKLNFSGPRPGLIRVGSPNTFVGVEVAIIALSAALLSFRQHTGLCSDAMKGGPRYGMQETTTPCTKKEEAICCPAKCHTNKFEMLT